MKAMALQKSEWCELEQELVQIWAVAVRKKPGGWYAGRTHCTAGIDEKAL